MQIHQYHLVDARARATIDLRDHASEIRRAFRYVPFLPGRLTVHRNYYEFVTLQPLAASDARIMGQRIAKSAKELALMAIKVYQSTSTSQSKTSKQLFKRKKP